MLELVEAKPWRWEAPLTFYSSDGYTSEYERQLLAATKQLESSFSAPAHLVVSAFGATWIQF